MDPREKLSQAWLRATLFSWLLSSHILDKLATEFSQNIWWITDYK